jgi:hypothetical protein
LILEPDWRGIRSNDFISKRSSSDSPDRFRRVSIGTSDFSAKALIDRRLPAILRITPLKRGSVH